MAIPRRHAQRGNKFNLTNIRITLNMNDKNALLIITVIFEQVLTSLSEVHAEPSLISKIERLQK